MPLLHSCWISKDLPIQTNDPWSSCSFSIPAGSLSDLKIYQFRPNDPWSSCFVAPPPLQLGNHLALPPLQVPPTNSMYAISDWFLFNRIVELKLTLSKSTQVSKLKEGKYRAWIESEMQLLTGPWSRTFLTLSRLRWKACLMFRRLQNTSWAKRSRWIWRIHPQVNYSIVANLKTELLERQSVFANFI